MCTVCGRCCMAATCKHKRTISFSVSTNKRTPTLTHIETTVCRSSPISKIIDGSSTLYVHTLYILCYEPSPSTLIGNPSSISGLCIVSSYAQTRKPFAICYCCCCCCCSRAFYRRHNNNGPTMWSLLCCRS